MGAGDVGAAAGRVTQRQAPAADTDRMRPAAFFIPPRCIVVECGPLELHVVGDVATWCLADGRVVVRRARWGQA